MKTYSNSNSQFVDGETAAQFPLVDSVMEQLTDTAIRALARKQVQRELRDSARPRPGERAEDRSVRGRAMRVACCAQSHMAEGTAQQWALDFLKATGIDARNCQTRRVCRYETLGDFVPVELASDNPHSRA